MNQEQREAQALLELLKLSQRDIEEGRTNTVSEVKERLKLRRDKLKAMKL
ncbi:hypothetical protein LRP52_40850 [Photobacterium sp. ZSDE20]|uniref:Histidine kinase n=1 Tax=Photobacterium pectinilyticum TaxID=2906793 RepID=A0ABT1N7S3_9GAMM|nr:hypothetical protein [Photobacterium sp. ZSDE20]MCQ1060800.1 hypothetical protein [Photobacterium sp. ZSDE20]MDD1828534.1 hypothetical protein [Photobacterium sp. ZSDE20]